MKKLELGEVREFNLLGMKSIVLHDSEYFKILNFNLVAGALFPVHSHDIEGQLSILVIEGEGEFLGDYTCQTRRHAYLRHCRTPWGPGKNRYANCGYNRTSHLIRRRCRILSTFQTLRMPFE